MDRRSAPDTIGSVTSPSRLEPGLRRVLQVLTAVQVLGIPLNRHMAATGVGVELPLGAFLLVSMPVPLLLAALVWVTPIARRLGPRLVTLVVMLESVYLLVVKGLVVGWLASPAQRDLLGLMVLLRLWPHFLSVPLLVAWQHSSRAAVGTAVLLCAIDSVLSLLFASHAGLLYPLLLMLLVARAATVIGVAAGVGWLLERQREQQARLAAANRQLANYAATTEQLAISQERNRLARELHDTLAHSVTAVTVQLEAIQALMPVDAASARTMLDRALETAHSGSREARRALHALRASPLEDGGLCVAIGNLARAAAARGHLRLELHTADDAKGVRPEQEQFLYRVAQEAIANVVRHARAKELRVTLERADGQMTLTVADDGVGFETDVVNTAVHFGLKGIEERVEMIGGRVSVDSGPGLGTTVRVAIQVGAAA
jgi:signal transduction histidine kinase